MNTMNIRNRYTALAAVAVLLLGLTVACSDDDDEAGPTGPQFPPAVETLRAALAPYTSLAIAQNAGYSTALTDCMSTGDEGAMGVHFAKASLLDAVVDPVQPEVLIYEPGNGGAMSLVGVEFVVPFDAVPRTAPAPVLFGQKFTPDATFGVWALHVWTQRTNPSGLFAPWNPRVRC